MIKETAILFIMFSLLPSFQTIHTNENSSVAPGLILYTPMLSTNTYLIDRDGIVLNTWHSNYFPGLSAYFLPNGNILRPKRLNLEPGASGGIQEFSPDGTLLWDYTYYSYGEYMTHHDVKALPNGNVLSLSHVYLSFSELVELGRNPFNTLAGGMKIERIIEIKPTGPTSGDIVWEWSSATHLIQDYDPTKLNYGAVGEHPELIDINYYEGLDEDLFHCNSIDYNPELRPNFSELQELQRDLDHQPYYGRPCVSMGEPRGVSFRRRTRTVLAA